MKPINLDLVVDVALRPGELSGVLHLHENDEVEVVPHVVFLQHVRLERYRLVVKRLPFQT